ncbi:MAG: beta-ribofuranosylaminobenzene 5'-phosphate synthase family protein [Halobacteriales archaeon]|nr:beta-ribofuranosylaminobenzene 5'-phosphate synthase family protein [Halobacteriales archaeon]
MPVRVTAGGRLLFGFLNLALDRERLYGGLGVALDAPAVTVEAAPADGVEVADPALEVHARRSVDRLDVDGARVELEAALPSHAGLGSVTQTALAVHAAIARAHDREPAVRAAAPALDRGGRSGVGVAAFERGGFVVDAGHPTAEYTHERPAPGAWTVPPVAVRHALPTGWRFVLVTPDVPPGRSGEAEEASMRAVVEGADASIADRLSAVVVDRLLPAVASGDVRAFGGAVGEVGRLNGQWYAAEQGGIYRPPVGPIVDALDGCEAAFGAGQSSWGPTVYAVSDATHVEAAEAAARDALADAGLEGTVRVARPRNVGATVEERPPAAKGDDQP